MSLSLPEYNLELLDRLSFVWSHTQSPSLSTYMYIIEVRCKPRTRNLKEGSFYCLWAFMFQEVGMKCHVKNMQSRKLPGRESRGFRKTSRKVNWKYHVFCSRNYSVQRRRETKRAKEKGEEARRRREWVRETALTERALGIEPKSQGAVLGVATEFP